MRIHTLLLSLSLAFAGATLTGCAATDGDPSGAANAAPYSVVYEGNKVAVTCSRPMQLEEFVKLAQAVTGKMYTYNKKDLVGEVSWVGTIHVERDEFDEFVTTQLKVKGMGAEPRRQGGMEVLEVAPLRRG